MTWRKWGPAVLAGVIGGLMAVVGTVVVVALAAH